jgi:hypothetical protein
VVSEIEVLGHVDYIVGAVAVLLAQVVQNFHFDQSLVVKSLLVSKTTTTKNSSEKVNSSFFIHNKLLNLSSELISFFTLCKKLVPFPKILPRSYNASVTIFGNCLHRASVRD